MNTKTYVLGTPPTPERERETLPWHVDPHNYAQILALESRGNKTERSGTVSHFSLSLITHTDTHSGKGDPPGHTSLAPSLVASTALPAAFQPLNATFWVPSPNQRSILRPFDQQRLSQRCIPHYRLLSNLRDQPQTCQGVVSSSQGMAAGRGYAT